jgi:alpha-L-fucosidase
MKPNVVMLCTLMLASALVQGEEKTTPPVTAGSFQPNFESLQQYKCPDWFRDAKFGIWAHWGPQCVPEQGDWYARHMYESSQINKKTGEPTAAPHRHYLYHLEHYGHPSQVGYKDIIPKFLAERWDPDQLMALYKKAGAKYFVSMGCHHDNFDMWNSKYHRWNAVNMGPKRDIVGEWQKAAYKQGLKFGVSEHLGASWGWFGVNKGADPAGDLKGAPYDGNDPQYADLYYTGNAGINAARKPGIRR